MSVTLNAAELDQRVTLQQRATTVSNDLGEPVGAWADVATVWAKAEPLRGREFVAAAQLQQALDVKFTLRWRAGVTASMRLLWRGEPYEIVGEPIDVKGAQVKLELMCCKGVRDGR